MSLRLPNSVFVHVPRTGGLWLGEVVQKIGLLQQRFNGDVDSHFTFRELPDLWRALQPFSFVRHPLGWIKSRWSHSVECRISDDHRHYGINRLFDEHFHASFRETVEDILRNRPGLVGLTFREMQDGIPAAFLRRTEDLPYSAVDLLRNLEGVGDDQVQVIVGTPAFNGTSQLEKYRQELSSLPNSLVRDFLASESDAFARWYPLERPLA